LHCTESLDDEFIFSLFADDRGDANGDDSTGHADGSSSSSDHTSSESEGSVEAASPGAADPQASSEGSVEAGSQALAAPQPTSVAEDDPSQRAAVLMLPHLQALSDEQVRECIGHLKRMRGMEGDSDEGNARRRVSSGFDSHDSSTHTAAYRSLGAEQEVCAIELTLVLYDAYLQQLSPKEFGKCMEALELQTIRAREGTLVQSMATIQL